MRRIRKSIHTQIYDFTTQEGIMSGVHYENGFTIGMSGRIAAILRDKYRPEYEKLTFNMYGVLLDGEYPNWRNIIKNSKEGLNANNYKTYILNYFDIMLFYNSMDEEIKDNKQLEGYYYVVCGDIYFSANEFRVIAKTMQIHEMNELYVFDYDEINGTRASFACNQDGIIAIMPTKMYRTLRYDNLRLYNLSRMVNFARECK